MKLKKNIFLFTIGLILLIIPYLSKAYALWRLFSFVIGTIFVTTSLFLNKKRNILLILIIPFVIFTISYAIDMFIFYQLKRVPIFVYEIKSSDTISTYNSAFYRIFKCNNELILDYGYEKNFVCGKDDMDVLNINEFLQDPKQSYNEYKNSFVKVKGKISKIIGTEAIELAAYTKNNNKLNGYVSFNLDKVLKLNIKEDLGKYRIYDVIEVIGKVDSIKNTGDVTLINLVDVKLIPSNIYDDYTYEVINNNKKEFVKVTNDDEYYFYGISSLNIKYDNDNIYELSYMFTDSRLTWNDLIQNSPSSFVKYKDETVAKKYILDKYNLVECANGKKIIVNKSNKINYNVCNLKVK